MSNRTRTSKVADEATKADAPVEAQPAEAPAQPAPVEVKERYAPESGKIAERLAKAKAAGWTRPALIELTEIEGTHSAVWRAEHGRVHPNEVELWTYALDQIESGKVKPPERARANAGTRVTRDDLLVRLTKVITLLESGDADQALRVARGDGDDA